MSPDNKRGVVKDTPYNVPGDLWTLDFASGRLARLTFKKEVYSAAVWSKEGDRIAYSAGRLGDTIYEKAASGAGDGQVLLKEPGLRHFPTSWSSDGWTARAPMNPGIRSGSAASRGGNTRPKMNDRSPCCTCPHCHETPFQNPQLWS